MGIRNLLANYDMIQEEKELGIIYGRITHLLLYESIEKRFENTQIINMTKLGFKN